MAKKQMIAKKERMNNMYSIVPFGKREANLFRWVDDWENNVLNTAVSGKGQFRCDISEVDGTYALEAELPGFDKEDISVNVDGDTLTISAAHESSEEQKDEGGNFIRRERRFGSFARSFNVEGIDVENIKASYKNGVLNLSMPAQKKSEPEARRIEIAAE